jgi:hypothetical protein
MAYASYSGLPDWFRASKTSAHRDNAACSAYPQWRHHPKTKPHHLFLAFGLSRAGQIAIIAQPFDQDFLGKRANGAQIFLLPNTPTPVLSQAAPGSQVKGHIIGKPASKERGQVNKPV